MLNIQIWKKDDNDIDDLLDSIFDNSDRNSDTRDK